MAMCSFDIRGATTAKSHMLLAHDGELFSVPSIVANVISLPEINLD